MNRREVTLRDIAQRCGTSVPTVSYVMSGSKKRYVNQEMRDKIIACAKELDYVPRKSRSAGDGVKALALVIPQSENVFFRRMIHGMESVAYERGYLPAVYHTGDIAERETVILEHLSKQHYQGFLLVPSERSRITTEMLGKLKHPFVVAERPMPCEGWFDFFSMDNYHAGYEATQVLIQAGHRHIGLITWINSAVTLLDRHVGYARALEEAGIQYRPEYVQMGRFSVEDGRRMTRELLTAQPELTALLYAYHVPAQGGIEFMRSMGIHIPEDISVVVAGDPAWVEMCTPSFTHVTLPSFEVGRQAVTALIDRIEKKLDGSPRRVTIKGTLVEGGSVKRLNRMDP